MIKVRVHTNKKISRNEFARPVMGAIFLVIGKRAKRVRHPLLLPIEKKCCVYSTYVKITMRKLTILREAEEWTHVHLQEACLLFASAITKSSLYLRQNDKAHAHQTRKMVPITGRASS